MNSVLSDCRNIHAVGRNYVAHIEELGNQVPGEPVFFSKSLSSLTTSSELVFPEALKPLHYELELVLRIGSSIERNAFRDLSCISHIGLGIDFTARALQSELKQKQLPWFLAKSFQNACYLSPLKPFEAGHHHFQLYRNQNLQQDGDSRLMIFDFAAQLSFLNRTLPLEEGDLLFTGTPAGVGPVEDGDRLLIRCSELALEQELSIRFEP